MAAHVSVTIRSQQLERQKGEKVALSRDKFASHHHINQEERKSGHGNQKRHM